MDMRPYIPADLIEAELMPRKAFRVKRVCEILDCSTYQVYHLIRQGQLEAFNVGGRSKRIYADSVAEYQRRQAIVATGVCPATVHERQKARPAVTTASARAAMVGLAQLGLI